MMEKRTTGSFLVHTYIHTSNAVKFISAEAHWISISGEIKKQTMVT